MRVLAIDTALEACSAAVLDTDPPPPSSLPSAACGEGLGRGARAGREGGRLTVRSLPMVRGHAEALVPLIATVMSEANIEFSELDRVAVTVGPGSFTGLRVGVAAARGIALAAGKPAVGLTTLAALAAPFFEADDRTPLLAAIDARHDRVYMQLFGPRGRSLIAPRITSIRNAIGAATASPTRIVGNAAKLIEAAWPEYEQKPRLVRTMPAPDVAWVAKLGAATQDLTSPVRPLYLSDADAYPQEAGILPRR